MTVKEWRYKHTTLFGYPFSQTDLATKCRVSLADIQKLERGQAHQMKYGTLKKIADYLGCTVDGLVRRNV